jgi:nucleoside-diphosphate-sugar epimerase
MTDAVIAVTGASGAIGQQLVKMLCANGFQVIALSRRRPQNLDINIEWRAYALADPAEVTAAKLRGVDQLVHLAAYVPGIAAKCDADIGFWNDNVLGTQRLIEAMEIAKTGRLVLAAAANIYTPSQAEADEDASIGPRSRILYLASKAAQEWLAASLCHSKGIDCAIMRISSVIADGRSIIDRLALNLVTGKPVQIADGAAFGADFIACDDVCQGLLLAVEAKLNGIYNLSSGKRTELLDVVLELARQLGSASDAIQMVHVDHAPDIGFPAINCDRLRNFGFTPKPLSHVLAQIVANAKTQLVMA